MNTQDLSKVKKVITFSDSCGGQNRNRFVVAFMMHICAIKGFEWGHYYMESGHSFLPNDSDFGAIERKKKQYRSVFHPDEWIEVIQNSKTKNPFNIIRMKGCFKELADLTEEFTFRTTGTEGEIFNWLKLKFFSLTPRSPMMELKTSL